MSAGAWSRRTSLRLGVDVRAVRVLVAFALVLGALPLSAHPVSANFSGYKLPWPSGQQAAVTKKNASGHENQVDFDIRGGSASGDVYAAKPGTVAFVKESSNTGCSSCNWRAANIVVIQHSPSEYSWYVHLAYNSVPVSVGQTVGFGTKIGVEGTTGWSSGVHLHFMASTGHTGWTNPDDPNAAPWASGIVAVDFAEVSWAQLQVGAWYTSQNSGGDPPPPPPPDIDPSKWYSAVNRNSSKCVDALGGGSTDGTDLVQYGCNNTNAQLYQFQDVGSGYYRINNKNNSSKVWDVEAARQDDGAPLQLWNYGAGPNQQWRAVNEGSGWYHFVARHSGKCLDVPGSTTSDGARLQQHTCNGTSAQSFRLAVEGTAPPPPPPPTPTDEACLSSQSSYPTITAGESVAIYVNVRNCGTATWRPEAGYGYSGRDQWVSWGNRPLWRTVSPNDVISFSETVTPPAREGTYYYGFLLTHNGTEFGPYFFIAVTVQPAPWTVSLSADKTSAAPHESVTLTAAASRDVGQTSYYIQIYDTVSGSVVRSCGSGSTCVATATGDGVSRTYRSRVSLLAGESVQATSSPVTVTWARAWTVSLSASKSSAAAHEVVTLTAVTNQELGGTPYYIQIYDVFSGALMTTTTACGTGTSCVANVSDSGVNRTFRAQIARSDRSDVKAVSDLVTVTWDDPVPGLSNDNMADATIVASLPFRSDLVTAAATRESGEPQPACNDVDNTVWYRYTAPSRRALVATTKGSNFDTILGVYTGTSVASLSALRCGDDEVGFQSKVRFRPRKGVTYWFQVGGWADATGTLVFRLRQV